jgi:hypothetical protein
LLDPDSSIVDDDDVNENSEFYESTLGAQLTTTHNSTVLSSPAKRAKYTETEQTLECEEASNSHSDLCDISHKHVSTATKPTNTNNGSTNETIKHTVLSPVKSVVSSISSLTLESEAHWSSVTTDSWCLPVAQPEHTDPLEIDSFFYKLKKVAL